MIIRIVMNTQIIKQHNFVRLNLNFAEFNLMNRSKERL